jgi:hypothetical protein
MAWRGEHKDVPVAPPKGSIVVQQRSDRDVFGHGVEVVAHVIKVKHPPVPPEVLRVGKEMPFVSRNCNGNRALRRLVIALALVPVMMGMENPIDLADSQTGQVLENVSRAEVDQKSAAAVAHQIDVARVLEEIEVLRQLFEITRRHE